MGREGPVEACETRRHKNGFAGSPLPSNVNPRTLLATLYSARWDALRDVNWRNAQCAVYESLVLISYGDVPQDTGRSMSA